MLTCICSLFIGNSQGSISQLFRNSWDALLYIFILVVGLLYSTDLNLGLKVLEGNLSFLGIPLIFSRLHRVDENLFRKVFYWFRLGLFCACLICLINAIKVYVETQNIQSFFFYSLTDIIGYQPTYFAYYLIFTITYWLYISYYQLTGIHSIMKSIGIVFLFFMLMLTGGQTAFVSILLIFSFFILKFLVEDKSKEKRRVAALVGLMLVGMFLTTLIDKGERGLAQNDAWDRLIVWESAIKATPNLLVGVGTGDYKTTLNEYYLAHDLSRFADENYNSHNQFIQLLFTNGILGVISLTLLIGRPLYLSAKNHNLIGILFVFPFLIYGITEVFLGRYQGIVFFLVIHQLCVLQMRSEKPSILSNPNQVVI